MRVTNAYISGDGFLYFQNKENNLVFRSINKFSGDPKGAIRYEWEILNIPQQGQPHLLAYEIAEKMQHPQDCVIDVDATISGLKYQLIHKGLLENLRKS